MLRSAFLDSRLRGGNGIQTEVAIHAAARMIFTQIVRMDKQESVASVDLQHQMRRREFLGLRMIEGSSGALGN